MSAGLPVSRLINVTINLEPSAAQYPSVTSCMIIGDSDVINVTERYRSYSDITEVADDFGTSAPEYEAADLFFGQNPQPEQLYIGRWASTATAGLLICGALTVAEQALGNWTTITEGEFKLTEDGGAATNVVCGTFAGAGSLNAIATIINTALAGAALTATCAWNGSQFIFTSGTTGAASAVAYLTAGNAGTDIHTQLAGTAATGAQEVNGIVAESALAALVIMDNLPINFYMVGYATTVAIINANLIAIASYVEADAIPHIFSITTNDPNALIPSSTEDIGYLVKQGDYNRTNCQYSSTTPFAVKSMQGRAATINYQGQNTTIDLMYKSEPGVIPEQLQSSQADSLDAKNYSYYATFNNGIPIIVNGTMGSGLYFDDVQGSDALVAQLQTDLFNLFYTTPTKIPLTDAGVHAEVVQVNSSLGVFLNNGQIGPGVWEFDGFGTLSEGDYLETGYYVFASPVATESQAQKSSRQSPPIQCAVIYAGAVQKTAILVNVQR